MNTYELTLIFRNRDVESLKARVAEIFQKHGVSVKSEEEWGTKRMAYEIDGEREGFYYLPEIESPPESIQKVINDFRLNSDILRFLFVNK